MQEQFLAHFDLGRLLVDALNRLSTLHLSPNVISRYKV